MVRASGSERTVLVQVKEGGSRRWFPIVASGRWSTVEHQLLFVSSAPVHAKEMGTGRTACGLLTNGWSRLWEFEFPSDPSEMCAHCKHVVEA